MLAHPLSLQARLMAAVIGFVSLILVVVAIITSATLGNTLEQRLNEQVVSLSNRTVDLVQNRAVQAGMRGQPLTAEYAMETDEDSNILSVNTQGGTDAWCMLGHAYWDRAYSQQFVKILASIYDEPRTADMLWEDIYAEHCPELHMVMRPYSASVIHEFDSLDELRSFDPDFINNVHSKVLTQITENLHCQRPEIKNIKPVTRTLAERSFRFEVNGRGYLYHYPDAEADHIIKPLPSQA